MSSTTMTPKDGALTRFGLPTDTAIRRLLFAGVMLRLVLFKPFYPLNRDDHIGVIRYILAHHAIPTSDVLPQGYHPPLYYLLAAPFAAVADVRGAELVSLVLSTLNLVLLARVLATTELITTSAARRHAMALAAFLPQFALFGLFVSNDALSYPVGTLIIVVSLIFIERPTTRWLAALGALVGVGLLTKGTFLAFVPVTVTLVLVRDWRSRLSLTRQAARLVAVVALMSVVGSYKFVENYRRLGRPVVHNLDLWGDAFAKQQGTILGAQSFLTLNLPTLVMRPTQVSLNQHSVATLLYATTWYSYIRESNLVRTRQPRWRFVASLSYLAGIVPSLLALLGAGSVMRRLPALRTLRRSSEDEFVALAKRLTALAFLVAALGIVIAAGIKYDVASCFQGRLLFPALLGTLLLFAWGFDALVVRFSAAQRWLGIVLGAAYAVFALFYIVEIVGTFGV